MKFIALPIGSSKTQYFINQTYVDYIQDAGYVPLMVHQTTSDIDQFVKVCGGLLLPGGADIDPVFYGENNYGSRNTEIEKDMFERTLLHKFIQASKPVFGICRGFQLIARELLLEFPEINLAGIEYEQHISNNHSIPDSLGVSRATPHHDVAVNRFALWGEGKEHSFERVFVNSMHHQGIHIKKKTLMHTDKDKTLRISTTYGPLEVLAYTSYGAEKEHCIIEAIKATWSKATLLGVQWHPEELKDNRLLKNFFDPYFNKITEKLHNVP